MLELKNISYKVEDKTILDNVNLTIESGNFVVITGPNGGGKSTLAKIIAGIEMPTDGQIFFNGEDITELSLTDRAKKGVSFAFQQPVRFKGLTVGDLLNLAGNKKLNISQMCNYLVEVGLCAKDYIDRELDDSLSGGELKRIEIAMTMIRKSQLAIFDEPEAGIDLWSFKNLINVFNKLHDEIQGTILIISHQERILDIADKIILIKNGKVEKYGKKQEVLPLLLNSAEVEEDCEFYKEGAN